MKWRHFRHRVCFSVVVIRYQLDKCVPVVLVLADVMVESTKNDFMLPLALSSRLRVVGGCRQQFGTQSHANSIGTFSTNCRLLSASSWSGMPYGMTQSWAKIRAAAIAVVFLVGIARVSFKYLSNVTTMNLLPILVFCRIATMSMATNPSGPAGRNSCNRH